MRGTLTATAIALFLLLAYPVGCAIYPLKDCGCCKGAGVHRSESNRRNSRRCWWCKGSGKRWRIGRRIWNRLARSRREGR